MALSAVLIGLAGYVGLCSFLRFRRLRSVQARYKFDTRESLSRMTNQEAHEIVWSLVNYEMPLFYDLSLRLALFETYAMENTTKLLVASSDLNKWDQLPKRYEDTEIIFVCFAQFAPTSPHLHKAIARMNYIHSPYLKSGKITQADMLYVTYASVAQSVKFLNQYEWRQLTDMEVAALVTMWKYVSDMMAIDYRTVLQKNEWKDPLEFFEDLTKWASDHEDKYMRAIPEVNALGSILMEMLLQSHPYAPKALTRSAACVLMGNRLRRAFSFPEPSLGVTVLTYGLLMVRRFVVRFLCLPRFWRERYISDPDETTGRIKHYHYMKEPWYCPDTIWARWNPVALLTWVFGGAVPGDGGSKLKPEGFLFEDLGPQRMVGQGNDETTKIEEWIRKTATPGCPFGFSSKA